MAKGARKTFLNTAQSLGENAVAQEKQSASQANTAYSAMMPQITQMLSATGDPAVTAATMGALGSTFGAAKQGVMDTAARTNNAASTNASLDQLARTQGAEAAQTAAQNVASQHQQATQLLSKIWGMSSDQVAKMLQLGIGANSSYGTQANSPILGEVLQAVGAGVGAAATHCWVAAELYGGWDAWEVWAIRQWLQNTWYMRPFYGFYLRFGPRWAAAIRTSSRLRAATRKLFDFFLTKAV